jgi:hypothetical protein
MKSLMILNYSVVCLSVLGVLFGWIEYLDFKNNLNPLIPASLAEAYYKPAVLYTAVFAVVIVLQLLSIRYKKAQTAAVVAGGVAVIAAGVFHSWLVGWFL